MTGASTPSLNGGPRPARGVLKSASWLMLERIVSMASALIVAIALTRHLGPADYGLLSFSLSFAAILVPIAALGLNEMVTRELVDRPGSEGAIMGTVLTIRKAAGIALLTLFSLFCLFGPFPDDKTRFYAFVVMALAIAGDASIFRNWFSANDRLPLLARFNIVRKVAFTLTYFCLAAAGMGLQTFVWVAALDLASQAPTAWLAYRVAGIERVRFSFDRRLIPELLGKSWPLALSSVAAMINLKVDIILLTLMAGEAEAGIYSVAAQLSEVWYVLPAMVMTAAFPAMLDRRRADPAGFGKFIQRWLDGFAAIAMLLAVTVSLVASHIVVFLYGAEYAAAAPILTIHIWAAVFVFMRALMSKWMIAEDLYLFSLLSHLTGAVVNVLLNLVLIPAYGGVGAAIATAISYSISSYFAFALAGRTREMFIRMSRALIWPLRLPELVRTTHGAVA